MVDKFNRHNIFSALAMQLDIDARESRLQKISHPSKSSLLIKLRNNGEDFFLRFSAEHSFPHFCLQEKKSKSIKQPPSFGIVLRQKLLGSRLKKVTFHSKELILETFFSGRENLSLALELSQRSPNICLLSDERKIITALFSNRSKKTARIIGEIFPFHLNKSETTSNKSEANSLSLSKSINLEYQSIIEKRLKEDALKELATRKKTILRLIKNLEQDKAKLENFKHYEEWGELLKSHFHLLKKGMDSILIPNLFSEENVKVKIPLEVAKSPQENLELIFNKNKKFKRGISVVDKRLCNAKEKLKNLENTPIILKVASEIEKVPPPRNNRKQQAQAKEFAEFTSYDGLKILVGRNSKENDRLTMVKAKGNDLWLHTEDYPGGHVIIRLEGGEVREESLLDAATLALFYSKAKKLGEGSVCYTKKKNIRKPKKAKAGAVMISNASRIHIKLNTNRLNRLLGREII